MKTKTIIKTEDGNTSLLISITLVSNGALMRHEHSHEKEKAGNAIHAALRSLGYSAQSIQFVKP